MDPPVVLPAELASALAAASAGAGPARARQLRWVAAELVITTGPGATAPPAGGWFCDEHVRRYLDSAQRGDLRRRATSRTAAPSAASMRVRRSCLAALARAAGASGALPATGPSPDPLPGAAPSAVAPALARWRAEVAGPRAPSSTVRAVAIAHLVHELGLRTAEVVALTLDHLDLRTRQVRVTPRPQAARSARPEETVEISAATAGVLQVWLEHRRRATARVPHVRALWVTLAANHDGDRLLPAGLPLRPRGVVRAHIGAVGRLNRSMAGTPGWRPLTAALADLRRPGLGG